MSSTREKAGAPNTPAPSTSAAPTATNGKPSDKSFTPLTTALRDRVLEGTADRTARNVLGVLIYCQVEAAPTNRLGSVSATTITAATVTSSRPPGSRSSWSPSLSRSPILNRSGRTPSFAAWSATKSFGPGGRVLAIAQGPVPGGQPETGSVQLKPSKGQC